MAIIRTKVPGFTGMRAGVMFVHGMGETENQHLIDWFIEHGYTVQEPVKEAKPVEIPATERKRNTRKKED